MEKREINKMIQGAVWGVLAGGVSGFIMGLLLAPEEGQKARRRLAYQMEHLVDQVRAFVEQIGEREHESAARQSGQTLIADARKQAEQILRDADALLNEMKHTPPQP